VVVTVERNELLGTRLAVLVAGRDSAGQEDWALLAGVVRERDGQLVLARTSGEFKLFDEWLSRVRATDEEAQRTLQGADYVLQLSAGDGPNEVSPERLEAAGLRWPTR
jgi:hypothetical protein